MAVCIILGFLAVYYIVVSKISTQKEILQRSKKPVKYLHIIIEVAPVLALVVFTILFNTVLKGRIFERSSHAILVFILWIYALWFYTNLLAHLKSKKVLFLSVVGTLISISVAVLVTPLGRFLELTEVMSKYIIVPGVVLALIFYGMFVISRKLHEKAE